MRPAGGSPAGRGSCSIERAIRFTSFSVLLMVVKALVRRSETAQVSVDEFQEDPGAERTDVSLTII